MRPAVILASLASAALVVASPAAHAARTYGVAGPKAVAVKALDNATSLVAPTSGGPYPLVIASHGFSASGDNQIGWAKHFASWGLVVAVPTFPSPLSPDTAKNASTIDDLVNRLRGPLATAEGVSTGAFGLEGHSAGGLATTVAALKLTPAATVLFDPVDKDGVGKAAYAMLCSPVLALFAEASSCNNSAGWRPLPTTSDLLAFDVKGSTHCDGENAARGLCGPVCGGAATADRQATYAHYATAFLLAHLAGDAAAATALVDATVAADSALANVKHSVSTCAKPTGDAGPPPSDGGPSSSSSSSGASGQAAPADPQPGEPLPPVPASNAGCGCRMAPATFAWRSVSLVVIALGALLARRRR